LRSFGLIDAFNLRESIQKEKLPSKRILVDLLKSGTKSLPPSISANFVASVLRASLESADEKSADKKESPPVFDLRSIKPGRKQASRYHKVIFEVLKYVFSRSLKNGIIERNVDGGRKRIDILFENPRSSRFFRELETRHGIFCPLVFVECKNYRHDPKNPEFDQLAGRFHNKRGHFGLLVCRSISDKKTKLARCGDLLGGGTGCIIVLDDDDIRALLKARVLRDFSQINDFLSQKLTEVLLNAR
jgi:hypothetical protein